MILEQRTNSTVVSIPAGMQIDLGAVGKGVALDEIRKTLEEYPEVSGAVISVGGSILTYGNKPEGGTWHIAVTDPLEPSQSAGVLTLAGGYCVSTSGDYERYVEVDGVRYHHILDPRTGSPARSDVAGKIRCRSIVHRPCGDDYHDRGDAAIFPFVEFSEIVYSKYSQP